MINSHNSYAKATTYIDTAGKAAIFNLTWHN